MLLIGLSLAMDCFAIALGISCSGRRVTRYAALKVATAFGGAQGLMALLGWLAGRWLVGIISAYDHWVVFGLLLIVGAHMIWESFHEEERGGKTRPHARLGIALARSHNQHRCAGDRAGAGLRGGQHSAGLRHHRRRYLHSRIIGFLIGRKAGELLGRWAGVLGGLILIGIGTKVLIEHLAG